MEGIKYNKLANLSHSKFKRNSGVSKYLFEMLFLVVSDALKLKKETGRPNKIGIADRILMLLEYYREYRTFLPLNSMIKPNLFDSFFRIFSQIGHRQRFFE